MKEKLLKVKEQIMQNKKKTAAIGIAVLLLIGAGGYGIVALNMDNKETAKAEQVSGRTTAKKTDKKDVTDKKIITDKKTEDKKSSNDKKEVKNEVEKKEDKKEAAKGNSEKPVDKSSTGSSKPAENTSTGSTGNSNAGNNSSQGSGTVTQPSTPKPEPPAHTHNYSIPMYTQQWVVDQPAWTETVSEPVYEMIEHSICNGCGADITGNPWGHIDAQLDAGIYTCGGYHSEWVQEQVGTNSYTVEHPEQGHYESVVSGYKCSCGAVQ